MMRKKTKCGVKRQRAKGFPETVVKGRKVKKGTLSQARGKERTKEV